MGFIKETYTNGRAGLVVNFSQTENDSRFCNSDSAQEAMKYFDLYLDENSNIRVKSESDQAMNALEIKPEEAKDFRKKVDSILLNLTDEQAIENIILFPTWNIDINYYINDRVRYKNKLYKALQNHTSQSDWTPDVATNLFTQVLIDDPNIVSSWEQPDNTNGYMVGDQIMFNEKKYESLIDNNVWSPADYPAGWEEIV